MRSKTSYKGQIKAAYKTIWTDVLQEDVFVITKLYAFDMIDVQNDS